MPARRDSGGIPRRPEDSCGAAGVAQSAGIFPDKIFLTGRAAVFAQRAVAPIQKRRAVFRLLSLWIRSTLISSFLDYAASAGGRGTPTSRGNEISMLIR